MTEAAIARRVAVETGAAIAHKVEVAAGRAVEIEAARADHLRDKLLTLYLSFCMSIRYKVAFALTLN
jgi:hypothetical protein